MKKELSKDNSYSSIAIDNSCNCSKDTSFGHSLIKSLALVVLGKAITSRILSVPSSNIVKRSSPKASPPEFGSCVKLK